MARRTSEPKQSVKTSKKKEKDDEPKLSTRSSTRAAAKAAAAAMAAVKTEEPESEPELQEDNTETHCYDLSEKEMKEINNAFDLNCSNDGEELLNSDNLKTAIRSMGFEPRVDEIKKLLKKYSNKSGKINRDGFHKIMSFKMASSPSTNDNLLNDEISRVFNLIDLDKTGLITLDNLRSISKELNEDITDEELREMITEADTDGDFQINKQEFYEIMKKTSLY